MKLLTVLSVLQVAAITALFLKLTALERSITASTLAQSNTVEGELSARSLASTAPVISQPATQPNQEQIRSIVREELATALLPFASPQASPQSSTVTGLADNNGQEEKEYQIQLEIAMDEVDYYVSQGSISDKEMSDLQMQLVKLDQSGRKKVMRKLVQALNSGDLEGRL
jgi:hypothetical protein